jgi:hypothetical protein
MNGLNFEASGPGIEKAKSSIKIGSSVINFTVEQPDIEHFGSEIHDGVIVYNSGWTETDNSLKKLRTETAKQGLSAVTLYHPRYVHPNNIAKADTLRIDNIAGLINGLSEVYPKVSAGGHSLGGMDLVRTAVERDVELDTIALYASAGLINGWRAYQSALGLFWELVIEERRHFIARPATVIRSLGFAVKTIVSSPVLAGKEGLYAGGHYSGQHIQDIYDKNTVIACAIASDDHIFPEKEILNSISDLPFDVVEIFDHASHNFTTHNASELAKFTVDLLCKSDEIRSSRAKKIS